MHRFKVTIKNKPELGEITLKLYMPLTADCYDEEYDDSETLDGRELTCYREEISAALERKRLPEEAERGLMFWYNKEDCINEKVQSVEIKVEEQDRQLCVAECRIAGELTPQEMSGLKEYLTGQMADGWGEIFEQQDIQMDDLVLNVHLWSHRDWSLRIKEEMFSHQQRIGGMTLG